MLKIHGGTRADGEHPLCNTCKSSTVMRGAAESQESIYCHSMGEFLKNRVVQCSSYKCQSDVALSDMRDSAWILSTDKAKGKIGFQPAKEWKETHKREELIPGDYD